MAMADDEKKKRKRRGERPDGLIQVSLSVGLKPDGKPDRKYFYGHSRTEAERKREAYRRKMAVGAKYSPNITVREWVDIYNGTYRKSENPAYFKANSVPYNRLVEMLGNRKMTDVRESDLQSSINELAGKSFSTCDKYRQAVKRVFSKARKNKIIDDDPSEDLQMPSYSKGTHRALESWEVGVIMQNWNCSDTRAGLWVMLMLFAGLRRGEMMALCWDAVDLDRRTLEIRQTAVIQSSGSTIIEDRAKTAAGLRIIPICEPLYNALSSVPVDRREGLVCTSAKGKQLTQSAVMRGLETFVNVMQRIVDGEPTNQAGRRTDLQEPAEHRRVFSFRAHDLRHTFCTFLYDAGVDVKSAAYFMGHADLRVTMDIYTHLSANRKEAAGAQYEAFIAGLGSLTDGETH